MASVIIVGVGRHRDFGLRSLRDAGHSIAVVDEWELVPVEWCDWYAGTPMDSPERICDVISAAGRDFDALLCWDELAVALADDVGRRLGIPTSGLQPALFRDKALMHRRLRQCGVPSPAIGAADTPGQCRDLVRQAGLPVVIKPADYGGSDGVQLARTDQDAAKAYRIAASRAPSGRVVVDRFVPGPEFSVECISTGEGEHHVLSITEKLVSEPPFFVELGHLIPAPLPAAAQQRIESLVADALTALGIRCGVSHSEVKLGPDGPVFIEAAGRQAGDLIPKLVSLVSGDNPYLLELAAVRGMPLVPRRPVPGRTACVRFFGSAEADPVAYPPVQRELAAHGLEHLLIEVGYWYPEGIRPPRRRGNGSRFGYCLLAGPTDEVRLAYDHVSAMLETKI